MSQNIEAIIATDKQAREIVQKARSRREQIMTQAAAERDKLIAIGEEELANLKSTLKADNDELRISLQQNAAKEFAEKKVALDKAYDANEKAWEYDIFKRLTEV